MNPPNTKDRLSELFRALDPENPSEDFTQKMITRIEKEMAIRKKKKNFLNYLSIALGIASIVLLPGLIFYFLDTPVLLVELPDILPEMASPFENFSINPSIALSGLVILILLLGDSILRKLLGPKNNLTL